MPPDPAESMYIYICKISPAQQCSHQPGKLQWGSFYLVSLSRINWIFGQMVESAPVSLLTTKDWEVKLINDSVLNSLLTVLSFQACLVPILKPSCWITSYHSKSTLVVEEIPSIWSLPSQEVEHSHPDSSLYILTLERGCVYLFELERGCVYLLELSFAFTGPHW